MNSQRARAAQVRVMGDPFMRRLKRFRQERNACIVSIVGNLLHDMPARLRASIEPKNVKTGRMNEQSEQPDEIDVWRQGETVFHHDREKEEERAQRPRDWRHETV